MYRTYILLSSIDLVKKFVTIANNYSSKISIQNDDNKINAKSIMSIFSLDLSKPLLLEIEGECPKELQKEIQLFQI